MKFGLNSGTINKINAVFAMHPEIDEAILYGSRAKGNYKPASDIDLTLVGQRIDLSKLNEIENQLDDLDTPYFFDVSVFDTLTSDGLIEHIKRVGQVFYKKK